ncbi:unnamed protein product [Lymnaea stagnalis]|uniref:Glutathione S-transferase n=1 Tax=Lymnaea stagnalis TaxID=6523 RepID=A0AAV2H1W4_LYMST
MKLFYFNFRGRGEMIRLLLKLAGAEFEDIRVTQEEWKTLKAEMPNNQMPVLQLDDGRRYTQSTAILTYLAKENGLYGNNNLERLQIDQILELILDYWRTYVEAFYHQDPATKLTLTASLGQVHIPAMLTSLESLLKENGSGFFTGSISAADIAVFSVIEDMTDISLYPKLQNLKHKVESTPAIHDYLTTRPITAL